MELVIMILIMFLLSFRAKENLKKEGRRLNGILV